MTINKISPVICTDKHSIYCPRCRLQKNFCLCHELQPIYIKTRVTLLIHYKEFHTISNTGHLIHKMLNHSKLYKWADPYLAENKAFPMTSDDYENCVLFPSANAQMLDEKFLASLTKPINLIVPDGNWAQAGKMIRKNNQFYNIRKVMLPNGLNSEYQLRKNIQPGRVCTYEAISCALGIIEGEKVAAHLKNIFDTFITRTLWSRGRINKKAFLEFENKAL